MSPDKPLPQICMVRASSCRMAICIQLDFSGAVVGIRGSHLPNRSHTTHLKSSVEGRNVRALHGSPLLKLILSTSTGDSTLARLSEARQPPFVHHQLDLKISPNNFEMN